MSILDDIPEILAGALDDVFRDAVYEVDGPSTGPAYDPTPGTPTRYRCKALNETWSSYQRANGLVDGADRKILILAATLKVEPKVGGRLTIEGRTFRIVSDGGSQAAVERDPAGATWTCRGRA